MYCVVQLPCPVLQAWQTAPNLVAPGRQNFSALIAEKRKLPFSVLLHQMQH